MSATNPLVGKTIRRVQIARDKGALRFEFDEGEMVVRADGDCCSHTWIESVNGHECLIGSPVLSVEDVADPHAPISDDPDHDYLQFYACEIRTERGVATIEYRNSSNGYYGGSLSWHGGEYDNFYGGVHGQNVSKNDWADLEPSNG